MTDPVAWQCPDCGYWLSDERYRAIKFDFLCEKCQGCRLSKYQPKTVCPSENAGEATDGSGEPGA